MNATEIVPAEAFPPGDFLRDELEEREWSQVDFADIIGKSPVVVNELILGKRELTPAMAYALADALGTSAQFWLNLETAYRLHVERQRRRPDGAVARRAKLYSMAPVKDMIKRGWIEQTSSVDVLETNVCRFLGIADINDDLPPLKHAARKSSTYSELSAPLRAWVQRARQIGSLVQVTGSFTRANCERALTALRSLLLAPPEIRNVAKVLADAGIRLVFVETISKAKVDGVTFWLDEHSPVIALSLRYDRVDWFWFTLIHELIHVEQGDGKESPIVEELDCDELPDFEQRVNEKAQQWLVPSVDLLDFIARTSPLYSRARIANFARRIKVHPGVVVGQLHRREEVDWSYFRGFLAKVREFAIGSALTDGWGFAPLPVQRRAKD